MVLIGCKPWFALRSYSAPHSGQRAPTTADSSSAILFGDCNPGIVFSKTHDGGAATRWRIPGTRVPSRGGSEPTADQPITAGNRARNRHSLTLAPREIYPPSIGNGGGNQPTPEPDSLPLAAVGASERTEFRCGREGFRAGCSIAVARDAFVSGVIGSAAMWKHVRLAVFGHAIVVALWEQHVGLGFCEAKAHFRKAGG